MPYFIFYTKKRRDRVQREKENTQKEKKQSIGKDTTDQ